MKINPYDKSLIAQLVLQQMPPSISNALIDDENFQKEYGIKTDAIICINEIGVCFKESELYTAIRDIFSGDVAKEIIDTSGEEWVIRDIRNKEKLPKLEFSSCKKCFIFQNLLGLFPDKTIRLNYLENVANEFNLPNGVREKWSKILSVRTFEDDEVNDFNIEIQDTPINQSKAIKNEILNNNCKISTLVPSSRKYYERLVGTFDGSETIHKYVSCTGKLFLEQLSLWQPYNGFMLSIFLSSHSSVTAEISIDKMTNKEVLRAFEFLEKNGDRLSQIGAIEIGLRVINEIPEIEQIIINLIQKINEDNPDNLSSEFNLLSSLFMLVDGQISQMRLFSKEPPFYRRLASLSQAALIHREIVKSNIDIASFSEWAFNSRARQFYTQSLVDMRREPRWNPDYASAKQLKSEFLGRILNSANKFRENINSEKLSKIISKTISVNASSSINLILPGPLEGTDIFHNILPDNIYEMIKTQLNKETLEITSFLGIINSAQIFCINSELVELAIKLIKKGNYQIINIKDKEQLIYILNGLAIVAAVSKSSTLANELRILVRRYRHDTQYTISIDKSITICIICASSRKDLKEWRNFVGDWFTELAFSDLVDYDGKILYDWLSRLRHIVPELWISCGRADAALLAYNSRNI